MPFSAALQSIGISCRRPFPAFAAPRVSAETVGALDGLMKTSTPPGGRSLLDAINYGRAAKFHMLNDCALAFLINLTD